MKSAELAEKARITYRQLDYWQQRGFIDGPSPGTGHDRDWEQDEIEKVLLMASLVRAGLKPGSAAVICLFLQAVQKYELAPGIWIISSPPDAVRQPTTR